MSDCIRKFMYKGEDCLSLPAERNAFTTLKTWLSEIADELNATEKMRKQVLIAADEIFTNIASYGYPHGDGKATVSVEVNLSKQFLMMTFSDSGIAYNPLETADPNTTPASAKTSQIGGLGIFLVKKIMDSVEYRREDERNILILKKSLNNEAIR